MSPLSEANVTRLKEVASHLAALLSAETNETNENNDFSAPNVPNVPQTQPQSKVSKPTSESSPEAAPPAAPLGAALSELGDFVSKLNASTTEAALDTLATQFLGRKGVVTTFLHAVGTFTDHATKKAFGKATNALKESVSMLIAEKRAALKTSVENKQTTIEAIDVTLPGNRRVLGHTHPLTIVRNEILRFFNRLGFVTVYGPEIETDYYNFQALNIPEGHPARATQDSFYMDPRTLLRTQTSNMQIRVAEEMKPPIAIVSPGRVYRRDTLDATHSYTFHQIEGMYLDTQVSFSDLKGVLISFCQDMFGTDVKIRFRPDYFPFTEPSCEISIAFEAAKSSAAGTEAVQWLEILGAGLMNPAVIENVGIDSKKYSGFAFGMGVERLAMLKYGIKDIRVFHENETSFLNQFVS